MNLFYLDSDLDKCAEYHIDRHVNKMILEAAQLICTALWVDKLVGFVPRKLTSDELKIIKEEMKIQRALSMEERTFPYLACHHNHPSGIWTRSSLENFYWTNCYAFALQSEAHYRYGSIHKSFKVLCNLPEPQNMPDVGFTNFLLAMPDEIKDEENPIQSYRNFYMLDKAAIGGYTGRPYPPWWNHDLASYDERYTRR